METHQIITENLKITYVIVIGLLYCFAMYAKTYFVKDQLVDHFMKRTFTEK